MNPQHHTLAWFCLRSHPKHEHIASANLKTFFQLEVFCPRFRSRKLTKRGIVWMTESLFPNYLFVRFDLSSMLNSVRYTPGVSHLVTFSERYPIVPDEVIANLKQEFGDEELKVLADLPANGDEVVIAEKAFWGMQGKVLRVQPAKQRVQVLMDVLGRATTVELKLAAVVSTARRWPMPVANV